MTVGERIRALREAKGLTQQILGERVGVSRGMIAQIERDTKQVTIPLGRDLARELGTTLDELAG